MFLLHSIYLFCNNSHFKWCFLTIYIPAARVPLSLFLHSSASFTIPRISRIAIYIQGVGITNHHTTRRARRDHLREWEGYGLGHTGGCVREGRRLQGGWSLHLQKSLLLLGNCHTGFAGNPTLAMEKESSTSYLTYLGGWVSMRKRKFGDTLDKEPAPTWVRWSFLNLPPSFISSDWLQEGEETWNLYCV